MGRSIYGYGAKNLALLQNKCKPSQLGKLIIPLTGKLVPKGKIVVSNSGNIIFVPQPHGVRQTTYKASYRLGLALLDPEDPRKVLHISEEWGFGPREMYERSGDVNDVVFPCGWA